MRAGRPPRPGAVRQRPEDARRVALDAQPGGARLLAEPRLGGRVLGRPGEPVVPSAPEADRLEARRAGRAARRPSITAAPARPGPGRTQTSSPAANTAATGLWPKRYGTCSAGPSSSSTSARLPGSSEPSSLGPAEHPRRVERGREQRLAHAPAVAAHGEADDQRQRGDRRRARVEVGREHADRARVGELARRRARARRHAARRPAAAPPRTRPRRAARCRRGAGSERWSTERAPALERDRHRAHASRTARRARAAAAGVARDRAHPRAGARSRRRPTRRRCRARRRRTRARSASTSSIHASAVVAPAARRGRAAPVSRIGWATRAASSRPEPRGARLARRATARSPSCPRTPSCRARASRAPAPRACASTCSSVASASDARRARDPAAGARDLLVGHAGDLELVLLRAPARERQVRVAVDEARAARRSPTRRPTHVGVRGVEARDPAAVEQHAPGVERQLGRAVVAQVRQARPRAGAAPARRRGSRRSSSPHRDPDARAARAASIASG